MHVQPIKLYYIVDPMCSWCYAFRPSWQALIATLNEQSDEAIEVKYVMGGLAPDSDQPMAESMRHGIANTWRQIEARTGAVFNHDYWRLNTPRRSTYPACRAVLCAGMLMDNGLVVMLEAIQNAYYTQAMNPSLIDVLCDIAGSIGLDRDEFKQYLQSDEVNDALKRDLEFARALGIGGFPSVIAARAEQYLALSNGYCDVETLNQRWQQCREAFGVTAP
ncbi:MAG: DsbA family protein [marine bacterium B5-7]|nr:MAG: DsbA family protein [marine bacterium B5-7]